MQFRIALALGAMLAAVAPLQPAAAEGRFPQQLSEADQARLRDFAAIRGAAIASAQQGDPAEVVGLEALLKPEPVQLPAAVLAGEWRCRVLLLGGTLPLTVYTDFRCRITDDAAGLRLQKLTGSQRTAGTFYDIGEARLGYAGAVTMNDDPPLRYGQQPENDQVGYLVPINPHWLRLEIPSALQDGQLQIIEFRRLTPPA